MPVSRADFDAHLAAQQAAIADLISADTDYIAAVDAFIALPPVIDLAQEDETVQTAITNVQNAKAAVDAAKARIPNPQSADRDTK